MGTVLLTPMQSAFVKWNQSRPVRRFGDLPPTAQEIFEAGYRAGMLEQQPKRKTKARTK